MSSISITLDSDDSGSDIEDVLVEPNEGLQNSTISSSGSEVQVDLFSKLLPNQQLLHSLCYLSYQIKEQTKIYYYRVFQ